jgi:hypothetical protein
MKLYILQGNLHTLIGDYTRSLKEDEESTILFIPKKDLSRFPRDYVQYCQEFNSELYVIDLVNEGLNDLAFHDDPVVRKAVYYSKNQKDGIAISANDYYIASVILQVIIKFFKNKLFYVI